MFKYFRLIPVALWILLIYPKVLYYTRHKDKVTKEKRHQLGHKIIHRINRALKVDIHIEGLEFIPRQGNVILVPNHQSLFDPLVLIDALNLPASFIAKKEIKKMWFIRRVAEMIDIIYIDREDVRGTVKLMERVSHLLKDEKANVIIYPEGTRTRNPQFEMLDFKPGALKMAFTAESTIIPVATFGSYKPLSTHYNQKKYRIDIHIFPPIPFAQFGELTTLELTTKLHQLIKAKVDEFRLLQIEFQK